MTAAMPLNGVRVLDLTRIIAGPLCTQYLAELGADVVKVESIKDGDDMRVLSRVPLTRDGEPVPGQSADFISVNRNKRSIAIDLRAPQGQALIRKLAAVSDVFVENFKVGDLARYGLDYASLREVNPGLVYCSVTGYGQFGALAGQPGFDSIFQGMTGMMDLTGDPEGEPQRVSAPLIDHATGQAAAIAILGALWHRRVNGGPGQYIDMALFDCGVAALSVRPQQYLVSGENPVRGGNRVPRAAPARVVNTRDGCMSMTAFREPDFVKFCEVIGRPDLPADPRFATNLDRHANEAALDAIIDPIFAAETTDTWLGRLRAANIICGPIYRVGEALESPHARERGVVRETVRPDGLPIRFVANPIRYSETPIVDERAPPDVGDQTGEILAEVLGLTESEIAALRGQQVVRGR